jgi:hypothetical protein
MDPTTPAWRRDLSAFRWKPSKDLAAIGVSWLLVTGTLYTATIIIGPETGGGLPYFGLYAILAATLFGIGLPLYWTVVVRKSSVADLGLTTRFLWISLGIQLVFAARQFAGAFRGVAAPSATALLPLVGLALAIGFFEAVFWRGWILLRLEEAFGLVPAVLLGSALYAAYHLGYGMPLQEMVFLFFIGVLYAVAFRLTRSVFILWPLFQPMGQLVTLLRDGLSLPPIAALGFTEVLALMWVLVWLAARHHRKAAAAASAGA